MSIEGKMIVARLRSGLKGTRGCSRSSSSPEEYGTIEGRMIIPPLKGAFCDSWRLRSGLRHTGIETEDLTRKRMGRFPRGLDEFRHFSFLSVRSCSMSSKVVGKGKEAILLARISAKYCRLEPFSKPKVGERSIRMFMSGTLI
jgi:hypothetical protein